MKPLDPQIKRLLDEVTSGDVPPAHLEDQLWQQLGPKLGGALPPTAAAASSALTAKSSAFLAASPLLKLSLGALIAGASVTAVVQHRSAAPTHEASPTPGATQAPQRNSEPERATNAAVSGTPDSPAAGTQPNVPPARAVADGSAADAPAGLIQPSVFAARAVAEGSGAEAHRGFAQPSVVAGQVAANGSPANARSGEPSANGREDATSRGASTLVAETQLLARAQRALRNGKPAAALPLIEQHAAVYPHGALAQERDAARVLALCALARNDEARRSQQQFLKTWPGSPLTERIQRACPTRTAEP